MTKEDIEGCDVDGQDDDMFLTRQRGSRSGCPEIALHHHGKASYRRLPRKTVLAAALITTLLLALLLISQVQQQSSWHILPDLLSSNRPGDVDATNLQHAADGTFRLHPQDHVFRDIITHTYHWRITTGERRPDGVLKRVYLINDAFPGPTLEVRSGDRLVIHVENALDDDQGLSIHWHGLWQRGSNDMDGAVGITQSPILPGETFVYDFTVDPNQYGTFWYHAHDGVQRADGLYGGLVVHQPSEQADVHDMADEQLLLIGDWYHRSAQEALQFYMHPGAFGLETIPDSVLVNGAGAFTCSDAVPARPLDCIQVQHGTRVAAQLDPQTRNILRVVNVGAYAGFSISLDHATLTPLSVDGGHRVDGHPAFTVGFLHPGERVDILVRPSNDSKVDNTLTVTLDDKPFKYENLALSTVHRFSSTWARQPTLHDLEPAVDISFDLQNIKSTTSAAILPPTADKTIVLYTLTQKLASLENEPHGFINHTYWTPQSSPLIELARDEWNEHQLVPYIAFNKTSPLWIDIVLNNLDEDSHPFHMHGHDFWVLSKYTSSMNWGSYNPFSTQSPPGGAYDLEHSIKKDTFYVPRRGYAVLRFRADNPGLWMFHCHVLWHQASGMAMAFDVQGPQT